MSDTVDAIAYKADVPSRVRESVGDKVDAVRGAISGTAGRMKDAVVGSMPDLPDTGDVRDRAQRVVGIVQENPIGLLLGGMAIGFLVGSLLPATDLENDRLGEFSDNMKQRAQDVGAQAFEHGKAIVAETVQAAQTSTQEHARDFSSQASNN